MHCYDDYTAESQKNKNGKNSCGYDMPFGMSWISRNKYLRRLPISPTYGQNSDKSTSELADVKLSNGNAVQLNTSKLTWKDGKNTGDIAEC